MSRLADHCISPSENTSMIAADDIAPKPSAALRFGSGCDVIADDSRIDKEKWL